MKLNKLIIKPEICSTQIKVMREIKALKKEIKEYAKRLAYLEAAINEIGDEEYSYDLRDSWYDYHYEWEQAKKALKELRDKYYYLL